MITLTTVLGVIFVMLQWMGFRQIWNSGVSFKGSGGGQFLYIIAGLHALHVLAGIIALVLLFIKAFGTRTRSYNSVPVELMSTYWHFVDLLWIYLFIFFMAIN
jgi:cytochrome c oxidase subunit III